MRKCEYIEITIHEALERIREGKPVYIDSDKKEVNKFTNLEDLYITDFDDLIFFTQYFKNK